MTREADTFAKLRQHVFLPTERLERVENGLVDGMPDVNFCAAGVEGWIELKAPIEPQRESTPLFGSNHRIGVAQANWFLKQRLAGGRAFLLIETDQQLLLLTGKDVAERGLELNKLPVRQLAAIALWARMKPIAFGKWHSLRMKLTGTRCA